MSTSASGERKVVCVTGGSGYIASWLVKLLLQRGYIVKATVRDPDDAKRTAHLLTLDGAKERLHLFKADLLDEGSFDSAVDGCVGVFHTASPIPVTSPAVDPQAALVDPALKGTLNVLRSCAKVSSIRRVILTSSVAAIPYTGKPLTPDVVVDETWFADPEYLKEMKLWYQLGKTLAEKAAWQFAEENKIDLVAINPAVVIGPLLQPTPTSSVEIILQLVNGSQTYPKIHMKSVDVRDVAFAHIQAFEIPSANGRYILVESSQHIPDILKIIHQQYPTLRLPEKCDDVETVFKEFRLSHERSKALGINYIPLEVSLKDNIESFKEKGLVSF